MMCAVELYGVYMEPPVEFRAIKVHGLWKYKTSKNNVLRKMYNVDATLWYRVDTRGGTTCHTVAPWSTMVHATKRENSTSPMALWCTNPTFLRRSL